MKFSIKQTLEEILLQKNCSCRFLSKTIGISENTLSKIMHGGIPSIETAVKIANFYGCDLEYLFSLTDKKNSPQKPLEVDRAGFYARYLAFLSENRISHYRLCMELGLSPTHSWKKKFPLTGTIVHIAWYYGEPIEYFVCKK